MLIWLRLQREDHFRKRHKLGCSQAPGSVIPEAELIALGTGEEGWDGGLDVAG